MSWGQLVQRKWYAPEMNRPAIKDTAIVTAIFTSITAAKMDSADMRTFACVARANSRKCLLATPPCFRTVLVDFLPHGSERQMKRGEFTQGLEGHIVRSRSQCFDGFETSVFKLLAQDIDGVMRFHGSIQEDRVCGGENYPRANVHDT